MQDMSWLGWGLAAVCILAAVMMALLRLQNMLAKLKDLITEILGVVVLISGVFLYVVAVPQWSQIQAEIAELSGKATAGLSEQVQTLYTLYFGSISLMMLGGLLTLFGLFGRMTSARKK